MKELDQLQASSGKSKKAKGGDLGGAMEGTEEIRQWVSLSFLYNRVLVTVVESLITTFSSFNLIDRPLLIKLDLNKK